MVITADDINTFKDYDQQIKATYEHHCGSDLTVANAARVSFGKRSSMDEDAHGVWRLKEEDKRLIQYLARGMTTKDFEAFIENSRIKGRIDQMYGTRSYIDALWEWRDTGEHKSPFNHCFVSFVVEAPVFVRAQLVKHEYLVVNEVSRRYVSDEPTFYRPNTWRGKSKDKKQGSEGVITTSCVTDYAGEYTHPSFAAQDVEAHAINTYNSMIEAGVAPEQARMVLPQSMMTQWWWSGSLGAFAKMCRLRLAKDAQYETRLVAEQVSDKMQQLFPVSWDALVLRKDI
jgi:thymidylate synthase (FAD)